MSWMSRRSKPDFVFIRVGGHTGREMRAMATGNMTLTSPVPPVAASLVSVIITPQHTAVMDPPLPLVKPLLEYRRRKFVPGGPYGWREVEQMISLHGLDIK